MTQSALKLSRVNSLASVEATAWQHLVGNDNPFVRYEFLRALEQHDCLQPYGWFPSHLLIHDEAQAHKPLVGALPLYIKTNSYGEFVFDWAWASAYERAGMEYYPKLVCSIPYTPATGARLLCAPEADTHAVKALLIAGAAQVAQTDKLSSTHYLFTDPDDTAFLREQGFQMRMGVQFHWENQNYTDFTDYLTAFTSKKRKQIRRERRDAKASGIEIETLNGHQITPEQWAIFYDFYTSTFDKKSGTATLSLAFFQAIGQTMPDNIVLILARNDTKYVAGALNLRGTSTLYGRHYGCNAHYRHLHFEVCYYRALDYCFEQKLHRFEAGAQGEHKLSRGFLPQATWSAHHLADAQFSTAVQNFLSHETESIEEYIADLNQHSPFKA